MFSQFNLNLQNLFRKSLYIELYTRGSIPFSNIIALPKKIVCVPPPFFGHKAYYKVDRVEGWAAANHDYLNYYFNKKC